MSYDDIAAPDAEQPTTVANELRSEFDIHASGESNFKSSSVEFKVCVWVENNDNAELVGKIFEIMQRSGYKLSNVVREDTTETVRIKGKAVSENEL